MSNPIQNPTTLSSNVAATALSVAMTATATAIAGILLVSPKTVIGYQPTGGTNIIGMPNILQPPLIFHYEGEQDVSLESDITDHYIETNEAVQDQVSLKPILINTHGFIGELTDIADSKILGKLKTVASSLYLLSAYTPGLSVDALLAYNTAFQVYQLGSSIYNAGVAAFSSAGLSGMQNKQQTYFTKFYGYWLQKMLFDVQTPWATFHNCIISKLRAVQDAETSMITDFNITFKVMRFADQATEGFVDMQGRAAVKGSPSTNNGTVTTTSSTSLAGALSII